MKVKILAGGIMPTKGSEFSAGLDVYAPSNFYLGANQTVRIPLGIAIQIENDEVAIMSERSSQGKVGITSVGNIIDSDYRGEISIVLQNNSYDSVSIKQGDRIGQIIIVKLGDRNISLVEELEESERGDGGFGSTGK